MKVDRPFCNNLLIAFCVHHVAVCGEAVNSNSFIIRFWPSLYMAFCSFYFEFVRLRKIISRHFKGP